MLISKTVLFVVTILLLICCSVQAADNVVSLGIIGLDTSHVVHFTEYINDPNNNTGCRIIAAYPGGSPDIPDSADRVEGFTKKLQDELNVEIVDSIETLCSKVDGVLLESVDGRPHLEQIKPVIAAEKPVFIDKPIAGDLTDAMEIFHLAKKAKVPCWSSSALRFSPGIIGMRNDKRVGKVIGCAAYGPCPIESHHPDLYWYGIHGVEMLFTIMGPGCKTVMRTHTDEFDLVVGVWEDGQIGTYRGLRKGYTDFGALVFGSKGIEQSGPYVGYEPLVKEIVNFFKTGKPPVSLDETMEIFAFMSAADVSKKRGGTVVSLDEIMKVALEKQRRAGSRKNILEID